MVMEDLLLTFKNMTDEEKEQIAIKSEPSSTHNKIIRFKIIFIKFT